MTIGNICTWQRSRVEQIHLVALIYEKDVKSFGFSKVLEPLVNDLRELEEVGDTVPINNKIANLKGSLIAMIGDNLGSHQIGGFNENFNLSGYFCRYCYINKANNFEFTTVYPRRTKDSYVFDSNMLLATNEAYRGRKSDSVLNNLKYYHVSNPGLPPCLAHDPLEGVVQQDLMLAIDMLVSNKIISYENINIQLKEIEFQHEVRTNLPLLKRADKLPGTAYENLWLLTIIPFVFEPLDLNKNVVWKMILTLRKIVLIVLSFKMSVGQVAYLKDLIFNHFSDRQEVLSNETLKPKHHFLLHYPQLILQFGPLRHLWTMRFENKHQYFKRAVKHTSNFKNVLFSLCHKHQLLQALNSSEESLYSNLVISDDAQLYSENDFPRNIVDVLKLEKIENCFIASNAVFRGTKYQRGMLLCFDKDYYGLHSTCKIHYIVINSQFDNLYFIGYQIKILYDEPTGLYYQVEFESHHDTILIEFDRLMTPEPILQKK